MGRGESAEVKDPRSTGRKRARKALEAEGRPYRCECRGQCGTLSCGAQNGSEECGWTPTDQNRSETLDANHKNKNWLDNDPANLEWLCRTCHRAIDRRSSAGEMHEEHLDTMYGEMLDSSLLESMPDY